MNIFFTILGSNIVPIITIIGLGFMISRKFDLNIFTLSKLMFYAFLPAFIFYNLYSTDLSLDLLQIIFLSITYMLANDLIARVVAKIRKYDVGMTNAFKNSIMFNNSGNIGVSLITLVFGSAPYIIDGNTPYLNQALTVQVMILVFINITTNTIGFYNAGRANMTIKKSLQQILSLPFIYLILLALLLKYYNVDITTTPIWPAIIYVKNGLVPMALLTLGVQLSKTEFDLMNIDVNISAFTRLIVGPILAFICIKIFGLSGITAQTVLISYSVPTAVNTALIAAECGNNSSFAAQQVMVSTVLSAITLTSVIFIAGILFPI